MSHLRRFLQKPSCSRKMSKTDTTKPVVRMIEGGESLALPAFFRNMKSHKSES